MLTPLSPQDRIFLVCIFWSDAALADIFQYPILMIAFRPEYISRWVLTDVNVKDKLLNFLNIKEILLCRKQDMSWTPGSFTFNKMEAVSCNDMCELDTISEVIDDERMWTVLPPFEHARVGAIIIHSEMNYVAHREEQWALWTCNRSECPFFVYE